MTPELLLALSVMSGDHLTARENNLVAKIHSAISKQQYEDKKHTNLAQFEREVKFVEAGTSKRLLSKVKPTSNTYGELSFVQAYYGVDFGDNLGRLLKPYKLFKSDPAEFDKKYPSIKLSDTMTHLDHLPSALAVLYLKRKDQKPLGDLLDLQLDGGPNKLKNYEVGLLWKRHAQEILSITHHNAKRQDDLATALLFNESAGGKDGIKDAKRRIIGSLTKYRYNKEFRVKNSSKELVEAVKNNKEWEK